MSFTVLPGGADADAEAAAWVARLAADDVGAEDFAAFDAWLAGGLGRAEAYDVALAIWTLPVETVSAPAAKPVRRGAPRWAGWSAGVGVAAAVAVGLVMVTTAPRTTTYVTQPGERREVALADGSQVALNGATRLEVRLAAGERRVSLPQGEAAFDVAHDAARPFVITSGERSVRVVGTAFDVRARGEALEVAVSRGVVEVKGDPAAQPVRLLRGDKLRFPALHAAAEVSKVNPDEAASWRTGRLIYHDANLGEVVQALNVQFAGPAVRVSPAAARLKFSGVLVLDGRDAVLRRLTYALPVTLRPSASGPELDLTAQPAR